MPQCYRQRAIPFDHDVRVVEVEVLRGSVARSRSDAVTARLTALGLDVVPSQTNFVLIGFPTDAGYTAEEANSYLIEHGYFLRYLPGQGLKNHLRLTIGTPEQNEAVADLLSGFLSRETQE